MQIISRVLRSVASLRLVPPGAGIDVATLFLCEKVIILVIVLKSDELF